MLHESWPPERAGESVTFSGEVVGAPVRHGDRLRFLLRTSTGTGSAEVPRRVRLDWYRPRLAVRAGDRLTVRARLRPPRGFVNPAGFDATRRLLARRIGATGRIEQAERSAGARSSGALHRFRKAFSERVQAVSDRLDVAALHRALSVGDRAGVPDGLSERLQRTGTAHLLAISGLHVGLVAMLGGALAAALATLLPGRARPDRQRAAIWGGLLMATVYAALAGFSLPTRRALVMTIVALGAAGLRRGARPGDALALALFAVLLFDPMAPLEAGFWLSFCAVAVLVWAFAWRPPVSGARRPGSGMLRAQAVLALGLLPLSAGLFGHWVPAAFPANLVAIPVVAFAVLPMLMTALALHALDFPISAPVAVSEAVLGRLLDGLGWLAAQPWSAWTLPSPGPGAMLLAFAGVAWLLAPRGWPARWLGLPLLLPLVLAHSDVPETGGFRAAVLDLGDGHAVLIRTAEQDVLFDTGPGGSDWDRVDAVIAPSLSALGVDAPDVVVVSGAGRDHGGGAAGAARRWPSALRRFPGGSGEHRCLRGDAWRSGGVTFRFLHPTPGLPDLGRDSGCVLEVSGAGGSLLLPGGAGPAVTARLAHFGETGHDAVVVARAGRGDALHDAWLAEASPRLAVVPAALRPARPDGTLGALRRRGATVLETGRCGWIELVFRPGEPPTWRAGAEASPRFWHRPLGCPQQR